ncbi:MAG TPA: hypothetical protein VF796_15880 [Humisphaera sp.]
MGIRTRDVGWDEYIPPLLTRKAGRHAPAPFVDVIEETDGLRGTHYAQVVDLRLRTPPAV